MKARVNVGGMLAGRGCHRVVKVDCLLQTTLGLSPIVHRWESVHGRMGNFSTLSATAHQLRRCPSVKLSTNGTLIVDARSSARVGAFRSLPDRQVALDGRGQNLFRGMLVLSGFGQHVLREPYCDK